MQWFLEKAVIEQSRMPPGGKFFDATTQAKVHSFCQCNKELTVMLASPIDETSPRLHTVLIDSTDLSDNDAAVLIETSQDSGLNHCPHPKEHIALLSGWN